MPDTVIARIQTAYSVVRRAETGRPAPVVIPYSDRAETRFGAKGTPGFTGGVDDCDEVYDDVLTLNAAAQVLDLSSLIDPDGRSVAFARVRWLRLSNLSGSTPVGVAPDVTDGWAAGPTYTLPTSTYDVGDNLVNLSGLEITIPGTDGGAVTAGSKRIAFDPGSGSAEVRVLIVGVKP